MTWLYDFLFFLQVGQGEGAAPAGTGDAANGAAEQAGKAIHRPCGQLSMLEFGLWMAFLFGLMYFLLIRPQKKQRQQHEQLVASLKKGDRVVTTGGILGVVRGISDRVVNLEVADGVLIRVRKEQVAGLEVEPKSGTEKPNKA